MKKPDNYTKMMSDYICLNNTTPYNYFESSVEKFDDNINLYYKPSMISDSICNYLPTIDYLVYNTNNNYIGCYNKSTESFYDRVNNMNKNVRALLSKTKNNYII